MTPRRSTGAVPPAPTRKRRASVITDYSARGASTHDLMAVGWKNRHGEPKDHPSEFRPRIDSWTDPPPPTMVPRWKRICGLATSTSHTEAYLVSTGAANAIGNELPRKVHERHRMVLFCGERAHQLIAGTAVTRPHDLHEVLTQECLNPRAVASQARVAPGRVLHASPVDDPPTVMLPPVREPAHRSPRATRSSARRRNLTPSQYVVDQAGLRVRVHDTVDHDGRHHLVATLIGGADEGGGVRVGPDVDPGGAVGVPADRSPEPHAERAAVTPVDGDSVVKARDGVDVGSVRWAAKY